MARMRLAIIGLGLAVKPHMLALAELSDRVMIARCATPSLARVEAFSQTYGYPATTDVEAAIADPSVDAVLVLTPPGTHLEIAQSAYASGKHVLMEKPLDVSLDRARALVEGADRAGVTLGVVLQHRFRDAALRLTNILAANALGRIQLASMTVPWWREQAYYDEPGRGTRSRDGGGVLMTQAIHTLDLFRSLVGPVDVIAAQATTTALHNMETEDYAAALVRIAHGAHGTITVTTAFYPGEPERIEIVGTLGTACIVGNDLQVRYLTGKTEEIAADDGTGGGADPMAFSHVPHRRLISDFFSAIENGRPPRVSGVEALRTQELIEAVLQAVGNP